VCERLGKSTVAIFGHSWGSALGVLYAARFPEKVAWRSRFDGQMSPRALWKVGRAVLGGQESSIVELASTWRGCRFSMKELIWFEHSGHEPFIDEPGKFNAEMMGLVRPALASDPPQRAA